MTQLASIGRWPALLAAVCLLWFAQASVTAQPTGRLTYELGTAAPGGVAHPLGVTIAALIKLKLLPQANINIDTRNTLGSRANALDLGSAELDFGILSGFDAYHAFYGSGPFSEDGANESLRLLTRLWTSTYHFVVRSDVATTGTLDDILDLRGKRIALGEEGSPIRAYVRDMFRALDVDVDDAGAVVDLGGRTAKQAFLDGDLDGFLLVDDERGAELAAFLDDAGDRALLLSVEADHLEAMQRMSSPAWTRVILPADALPGQDRDHATIGMNNLLCARADIPDDDVYQIIKTIFDNLPFLQGMHVSASAIDLDSALAGPLLPAHNGAARYYREVGVTVPEPEPLRVSALTQSPFLKRYGSVDDARLRVNESTFTILGESAGHTTTRMITELAASLAERGIRVIGMTSSEPAENIADVLYARGVDSAAVPLDLLTYALEENVHPGLGGNVAYVTELFAREVHLLTSSSVGKISDLIDRRVNLGLPGSASAFTVSFLLDRLNIPVEPTYFDERTALAMLQRGELAALFTISGKPMPLLASIPADSGLRLVPVPLLGGEAYRSATIMSTDYPNLLRDGETIGTFDVRSVLLSYNWRTENPRFRILSSFVDAFFERLTALQEPNAGNHPKWREIDPRRDLAGWRRSPAAQQWIERQNQPASPGNGTNGG